MEIRQATQNDYEDFCRLVLELDQILAKGDPRFFKFIGTPPRTKEEYESERTGYGTSEGGLLMAFEAGMAVGAVSFYAETFSGYPALVPHKNLFLPILTVDQRFRRRGIGKALLEAVKVWANERGYTDLRLATQPFNRSAIAFYQEEGFDTVDLILNYSLRRET
jgi:ribosomal protein S18 acetylase RimI-like enzyme